MNPSALTNLHPFLRTKGDVNNFALVCSRVIDALYTDSFDLHNMLLQNIPYEIAAAIEKSAPATTDKKALQEFFLNTQKMIATLPMVHIILPFSPKEKLVKLMQDWFYQSYQKTVVLDISVDPNLIGGSVISFRGRANDYSLKNAIDQMN